MYITVNIYQLTHLFDAAHLYCNINEQYRECQCLPAHLLIDCLQCLLILNAYESADRISSRVIVPACDSFGLWPFRFVAISVHGRFGLWLVRFVADPVCGLLRFVAVSVVAASLCGRYDVLPTNQPHNRTDLLTDRPTDPPTNQLNN